MRVHLRILVLATGCCVVAVEALSGNGPIDATAILTVAGVIAL